MHTDFIWSPSTTGSENSGRSRESERARETEKDLGLYHETNMKRFGQRQKNRGEHVAMGVSRRKLIHSQKSK